MNRPGTLPPGAGLLILIRVALVVLIAAGLTFLARRAALAETRPLAVPDFEAMAERDLAAIILTCRDDARYAATATCENAELALQRRYAALLKRNRLAVLRSPLFWIENPISAANVRRACALGERWAQPYCGIVPAALGGRRT